jgi:hypothetical protein
MIHQDTWDDFNGRPADPFMLLEESVSGRYQSIDQSHGAVSFPPRGERDPEAVLLMQTGLEK